MLRSLRSRLILASVLWTAGLLMLMHLLSMHLIHALPSFRRTGTTWPVIIGILAMAAGLLAARYTLQPFRQLNSRLIALRTGGGQRVVGAYPTEVQPLIDNLNALLEEQEQAVKRAQATAGDLAHGLKTPLAILAQEADRASAANPELAEGIAHQVDRMARQVNYHLARARAAASGVSGTARTPVADCVAALVRTLTKLHAHRTLEISTHADGLHARVQREDLDEMLGNLLDNACKWANGRITLEAVRNGGLLTFTIDDDGPGLPAAHRAAALERGVRLDEAAPGSGLGLAIVRDLAELYGGSVSLDSSPMGGLRARLTLPAA